MECAERLLARHACNGVHACRYWHGRGLSSILISGLLNVLALGFTLVFSTFLLLFVNWPALHSECIVNDTCDIASAVIYTQVGEPLAAYIQSSSLHRLSERTHARCVRSTAVEAPRRGRRRPRVDVPEHLRAVLGLDGCSFCA